MPTRRSLVLFVAGCCVMVFLAVLTHAQPLPQAPVPQGATPASTPTTGAGLIVGQVIDAKTKTGVPDVVVMINGAGLPSARAGGAGAVGGPPRSILTDAEGHFVFYGLPKGSFSLSTQVPGGGVGSFGTARPGGPAQQLELGQDERIGDITIKVWRYAALSGTVVDEAGEPMPAVTVRSFRRSSTGGQRRLVASATTTTDDRGFYRMSNLPPTDYVVAVVSAVATLPAATVDLYQQTLGTPAGTELSRELSNSGAPFPGVSGGMRIDDQVLAGSLMGSSRVLLALPPSEDGKLVMYPTTFYPSASSSASATMITLASGDDRTGVDFSLKPVSMLRVTGTVTSPDGPAGNTGVRLIPADADEFSADASDATQATTNAAGAFTFLGVAPGDYVLKVVKVPRAAMAMSEILIEGPGGMVGMMGSSVGSATAPLPTEATYWASVPVSVTNKDLRDVTVTLHAGVHISGHAVFEGTAAHPPAQTVAKMPINIDPAFGTVGVVASPRAQFDEAGQFASQGVPAGKYVMRASSGSPSWTLKSVMSQGRDVSEVPLDVSLSDITDVVVTFTDEPIELSGTIRDAKDAPDPTATLILFPVNPDERVSYGPIARRIKTVRATTSGTYKLPNLVAGDYFVAAVRDETITDAQDPAFLTALVAFATRVTLVEGDKKTQDVKTGQVK